MKLSETILPSRMELVGVTVQVFAENLQYYDFPKQYLQSTHSTSRLDERCDN